MGSSRLAHCLFGAVLPIAIAGSLLGGDSSRTAIAVAFGIIALTIICRLAPRPRPLSTFLTYPALLFGMIPLLQAIPLPNPCGAT